MTSAEVYPEGNGWSAWCPCGWFAWNERRAHSDVALLAHGKKCKGVAPERKSKPQPKHKPRTSWDTREESTWIDKL